MKHKSIILQFLFFYSIILSSCNQKKQMNMLQKEIITHKNQEIKNIYKHSFQSFYLDQKPKRMVKLRYKDLSISKELKCIIESIKTNLSSLESNDLVNIIAQFCFGHSFKGLESKLENSKEIIVIEPNNITNKRIFDVNYVSEMGFFCYLDKSFFSVPKLCEIHFSDSNRPCLNIENFQEGIKSLNLGSFIKKKSNQIEVVHNHPFDGSNLINLKLINDNNLLILNIEQNDTYHPICFINNKNSNDLKLKFQKKCVVYPKYENRYEPIYINPCFGECLLLIPSILDLKFEKEKFYDGHKTSRTMPYTYMYDVNYKELDAGLKKITFIKLADNYNFQKPTKKYFDNQTISKRCSLKLCNWLNTLLVYGIIHYKKTLIVILLGPIFLSFLYKWLFK